MEPLRVTYTDFEISNELASLRGDADFEATAIREYDVVRVVEGDEMNPSLEYLHGYTVFRVLTPDEGYGWAIEFDNGAVVTNQDEMAPVPDDFEGILGLSLITTIFSATDTTLRLGTVSPQGEVTNQRLISLSPLAYSIADPRFGGEAYTPQAASLEDAVERQTIRDQFEERAVEAPTADPPENVVEAVQDANEAENVPQSLPRIDIPSRPTAELS